MIQQRMKWHFVMLQGGAGQAETPASGNTHTHM